MSAIGKKIKKIRRQKKLSQEQLAYLCGLRRLTIIGIENGKQINPKINTIKKIASALGISIDELLHEAQGGNE